MSTWLLSLECVIAAAEISPSTKTLSASAGRCGESAANRGWHYSSAGGIVRLRMASRPCELGVFLALEIWILKNIRRGTHQAETHPGVAGIAGRENVARQHDNVMRSAVGLIVRNFIDTSFEHDAPGGVHRAALQASFMMGAARVLVGAAKTHSPRTEWQYSRLQSGRAHGLDPHDKADLLR